MPFKRQRADLNLTDEHRSILIAVSRSRTDEQRRVERARILLAYAGGETVSSIARRLDTNDKAEKEKARFAAEAG